eukprot:scaffold218180_cov17-Tisochrysis_lutea.AAC.1
MEYFIGRRGSTSPRPREQRCILPQSSSSSSSRSLRSKFTCIFQMDACKAQRLGEAHSIEQEHSMVHKARARICKAVHL